MSLKGAFVTDQEAQQPDENENVIRLDDRRADDPRVRAVVDRVFSTGRGRHRRGRRPLF
jgi:hypothetical protein